MQRTIIVDAGLPYYRLRIEPEPERELCAEAIVLPRIGALYRLSLVAPREALELEDAPPRGFVAVKPSPPDLVASSVYESIKTIFSEAPEHLAKPSFRLGGLKGILRIILSGGRRRPETTPSALYKSAYMYAVEVLGLTGPPLRVETVGLAWRRTKIYIQRGPRGSPIFRYMEVWRRGEWVVDRLSARLASSFPDAYSYLADLVISTSGTQH